MDFDLEKIKQEADEAKEKKAWLGVAGDFAQGFSSVPSSYELLTGKKSTRLDVKGSFDRMSGLIADPRENLTKDLNAMKASDELTQAKNLADPNSRTSKAFKAYAVSKGWVDPKEAEAMSGRDILTFGDPRKIREIEANADVDMRKSLALDEAKAQRDSRERAFQAQQKDLDRELEREKLTALRNDKAYQAEKDDRKKAKEFQDRYANIGNSVQALKSAIDEDGTFEAFGSHNQNLAALIDSIAIDSAKMFDPESVARESEVAAFRKMLFEPGTWSTSNSTAKSILDNYMKMLDQRKNTFQNTYNQQISGSTQAPQRMQIVGDPKLIRQAALLELAKRERIKNSSGKR